MNVSPLDSQLVIADRTHSRFEMASLQGDVALSRALPQGSRPCGIDFLRIGEKWYAAVGSLDDPQEGRQAPIYILDALTFEVLSTIRPGENLGVELALHIHNVVWKQHAGNTYLLCQAWNPGYYFVLAME